MDASGVTLVLIGPGSIDQVTSHTHTYCNHLDVTDLS